MSSRLIKAVSVLLCAILTVGSCLAGCKQNKRPTDYNEVTQQDVYDAFKELYPDAKLDTSEHKLYLNANGQYPIIGDAWLSLDIGAYPREFYLCFNDAREIDTVLSCYMKIFYDDWSADNTEEFFEFYTITDDSAENNYSEDYTFHGWTFDVRYWDENEEIIIILM